MTRTPLEEKIRDYAIDEGILGKKLPNNPRIDFAYEINFPPQSPKPMKLLVIKPKDAKPISIQAPTRIAPNHMNILKQQGDQSLLKFFTILKKYVLNQNLLYNIAVKDARYIILDNIYPDGLTEDRFYLSIRKVFNTAVFMNVTLNEIVAGSQSAQSSLNQLSNDDFGAGNTMFT